MHSLRSFDQETSKRWFALRARPNHEKSAAFDLTVKEFEVFLPLRRVRNRWADRFKLVDLPLFPGYVFARIARSDVNLVLSTPGVLQIVGRPGHPEPVLESEITAIQRAVAANAELRDSDFLTQGQQVVVASGPLAGVEGRIVTLKGNSRLVLSISLLQRSVSVEIDETIVGSTEQNAVARAGC